MDMEKMKIFLDLDGVLVDFIRAACEVLSTPYPPTNYDWCKKNSEDWDKLNKASGCLFFEFLDWMPDGKEILQIVENVVKPKNIYLLTTSMPNSRSVTGKLLWIKRELPQYYNRTIFTYAPKSLLAKSNHILIDDKDDNVVEFNKAGGKAILVPRPWNRNRKYINNIVDFIKLEFLRIDEENFIKENNDSKMY